MTRPAPAPRPAPMSPLVLLTLPAALMPLGRAAGQTGTRLFCQSPTALAALAILLASLLLARGKTRSPVAESLCLLPGLGAGALLPLMLLAHGMDLSAGLGLWLFVAGWIALVWHVLARLGEKRGVARHVVVPALFGLLLLHLWEIGTRGFGVPAVLLPPPSAVLGALVAQAPNLWDDFLQTVVKSVLRGYALGCGIGFLLAILADRVPFLARGLLPFGNLASALPVVGIAPIMVMWFGFDWPSKAAVVVVMTVFPMLANTLAGLKASQAIEIDLMRSYGAGYWRTLVALRLPNALPFVFNGLKINSTLALIGAIVAESFGTPVVGMGFRISTEVARMDLAVVWASIAIAGATGSLFYGGLAWLERRLTGWHPSYRHR
jgi:NitT/TauT family transport system permease protein